MVLTAMVRWLCHWLPELGAVWLVVESQDTHKKEP